MKKTFTKVLTLVLSLALVAAMCIPAFAADAAKFAVSTNDNRTYALYQIITGTPSGGKLVDLAWGQNAKDKTADVNAAAAAIKVGEDAKALTDFDSEAIATVSASSPATVDAGWYLAKDTTKLAAGEVYSTVLVKVVDKDVVLNAKADKAPTFNKKTLDTNDSTTPKAGDIKIDDTGWQDSADYDIGDSVPFKLHATLPENMDEYDNYYVAFHDTQEKGITYEEIKDVVVAGVELTEDQYTVTYTTLEDGTSHFDLVIEDLKALGIDVKGGNAIDVIYTGILNESAHNGSYGEVNEAWLEYSANPESPEDTNETPHDSVIVFTYNVVVNKVDENGDALTGAQFKLEKYDATEKDWVEVALKLDAEGTTFTATGVDDGMYRITETKAPDGYNAIAPIEFEVTAAHDTVWEDKARTEVLTSLTGGDFAEGNVETGSVEGNVENKAGATLPETGGMGTVILYALGSILVMGAGVLMFTKFRTSKEN